MNVCLSIITRNNASGIGRCLISVKPWIDSWIIVDAESTDGTPEIIQQTLEGIPGELHSCAWVGDVYNLNVALQLAKNKADYLLFMDPDDELIAAPEFQMPFLIADNYFIQMTSHNKWYNRIDYQRILFKIHPNVKWVKNPDGSLDLMYMRLAHSLSQGVLEYVTTKSLKKGALHEL